MTESSKPPSGRRMKAHAPPPPQVPQPAPRHIFRSSTPDGGGTPGMDAKENILRPTVDLRLTLPQGYQTSVIEDGSKALMDLLVELCSRYHLNPALHTLELLSPEGQSVGFKPNALLGSLNVASVLIKEKVWEEKVVRRPAPKVPEKTVRLMVNFHGSQKAVVRVNPLVPLQALIPVICDKCEFEPAHVLLLKDSISRHELPLDKSLAELGIKDLYVHDQSLVFQPKMASAPALNYTDSLYSSTASLGRPGKKGFLGIFQFSRRKSKTESTSKDMDDCDDKISQNTDMRSDALSTVSGIPCIEDRTVTLGQSQSVTSIPRMSPKSETKKRRAPAPPGAPTPSMGHASYEGFQVGLGSESQQRKRKAPAPPPTPTSVTQGSDDASAAPTPESCDTETQIPALFTRVAQSVNTLSASTVVTQTAKQAPIKVVVQPLHLRDDGPNRSSPTPSSSTADSLTVQDSSSEFSHSIDDSDADLDQAGSRCSTLTSSSASGSARVQTATTQSSTKVEESTSAATASDSSSRSETESALNLKLEEVENNRHSAVGNTDRPVPPKPRRSLVREPPLPVKPPTLPTLHAPFTPIESTVSNPPQNFMEVEETSPQSWLHSTRSSAASGQKPVTEAPEDETLSLGSSSSSAGSSLPDQGYAASEGMVEGEDSGMVSSPSDTQPTSPDGSLSLDGNSGERGEKLRGPPRDSSSDSDEGCATWGSVHRHKDISPQAESASLKESYEDDHELTAQLHQTLADFEADLAGHIDVVSAKDAPYTMSRDSNEVPVSVVDMDVPVTAIDEVLEEYERHGVEHKSKLITRTESAGSKGPDSNHKSNVEPQNKNNNAYTAAVSDKKSNTKRSSQYSKQQESKFISVEKEEKIVETKTKKTVVAEATRVKKDKPPLAAKTNVDVNGKSTEVCSERRADPPSQSQRSVSAKNDQDTSKVYQNNSSLSTAQGKITRNVTSRFGMKTFTVVPPKPAVLRDSSEQPAVRLTTGAIRIDDQGNMVTAGLAWNKFGASSESEINSTKDSPLLGKAKAFWSSNERQEIIHNKSPIEESNKSLASDSIALVETQMKTSSEEQLKTTQSALSKTTERIQPDKVVKEAFDEPVDEVKVSKEEQVEVESKISKSFQLPSNKPVLPPPLLPDLNRDLSFLKPSRRTSSQYVASAINKYTPKSLAKPTGIPKTPDYSAGLQRSGRSIQVNPHQSSQSFFSDNKENVSISTSNPPGPKRSMSYPESVSDSQRDFGGERRDRGGFESQVASTKETPDRLETVRAHSNHIQSSGTTQIKVTTYNDGENVAHSQLFRPRSPSPAPVRPFHSSTKPPTAPKIIFKAQTNSSDDVTKTAAHVSSNTRQQPSVTVSDSGVTPGPPAVTLFGPIAKFRPVIHKAVEKETSLHSSLMEAIQTGGGRDRLKKISTSGPSSMEKVSYVEEENERSALLAAIRAQSNSGRLRKTKSEAADELEKFRKVASEEERKPGPSSSPSSPSLTCTPPVFNPPPPPPPASTVAPPPPVLPQAKPPSSVAHPNASMNPALAREAMLDAIRSGSAAEKLKKVAAPTKTLQVNGRLGTIQPTSSTSIPQ